LRLEENGLRNL